MRNDDFFTISTQRTIIEQELASHVNGTMMPLAICDDTKKIVGKININGITRGAFQSGRIGYWVSESLNQRGVATRAVSETKEFAFTKLELHRLQAETLISNTASQRVLERNGFATFGFASQYLKIAGEWQDHVLYHVLNTE